MSKSTPKTDSLPWTLTEFASDHLFDPEFLEELGIEDRNGTIVIPYRLEDMSVANVRGKIKGISTWQTETLVPYGLWKLNEARAQGYLIICQTEEECWRLWQVGLPALGCPDPQCISSADHFLQLKRVFLLHQSTPEGTTWMNKIRSGLQKITEWSLQILPVSLPKGETLQRMYEQRLGFLARDLHALFETYLPKPLKLYTAQDILTIDWPEPQWIIQDMMPQGLTLLGGEGKLGKSYLALQLALSVSTGGKFLGRAVQQGRVLYLAIDEPPDGLRDKLRQQHWPHTDQAKFMLLGEFEAQLGDLRNGGSEKLSYAIEQDHYRFIVIDTFSEAARGIDQNDRVQIQAIFSPLQLIAAKHGCGILLIDHHNKMATFKERNLVKDVLGSSAKGQKSDTIWGFYGQVGRQSRVLDMKGRRVAETSLNLWLDWATGCYQTEEPTERQEEVLEALAQGGATFVQLVEMLHLNKGSLFRRLKALERDGYIKFHGRGKGGLYTLVEEELPF